MSLKIESLMSSVLRARWLYHAAAALLTFIYWGSGIAKVTDFSMAQGEMAHFGLNPPAAFAIATIIVQLGGSLLVILGGRLVWLGAGALAVFTLLTIPIAHRFWELTGEAAFLEKMFVFEHITVVGGLIIVSIAAELRRSPRGA
jgi:transmembrane protein